TRVGNVFTGYRSSDGVNWTIVGSQSISLPSTIFLGMAATSHNTSALTTAQFRQFGENVVDNPPAAPTGVVGTATASGNSLDWADNTETDLAGYNVYRATASGGTYTK